MNIDERMEEMRRRMEERSAKAQSKMDNLMNKYGLNSSAGCPPPPPSMPTFSAPPIPTVAPPMPASCACDIQFCPECGTKCDADAFFCENCGTILDDCDDETTDGTASLDTPPIPQAATGTQHKCLVDFEKFEDWEFVYRYESDGEEVEKRVQIQYNGDDEFLYSGGQLLPLTIEDFAGCIDVDDCGVVIAKRIIDDNDNEVRMSFFFDDEENTLTGIPYWLTLDANRDYARHGYMNTALLTLYAGEGRDVARNMFYSLSEEEFYNAKQWIEDEDNESLYDFVFDTAEEIGCNETFDLWGDEESEVLSCTHDDGEDEYDDGNITVAENNVFREKNEQYIIYKDAPVEYLLIVTDRVKRSYAEFEVPESIEIGAIHFIDNNNAEPGVNLYCEGFGDTITSINGIRYEGRTYGAVDCSDAGTVGDLRYYLYMWDNENNKYSLCAEM